MGKLDGKVAFITGGCSGMGEAHVRRFVAEGAKVAFTTDRRIAEGEAIQAELGPNALFIKHDVSKEEDWVAAIAKTEEAFGPIDILINNAGFFEGYPIEQFPLEKYMHEVMVDQVGVFLGMKTALPSMRKAGGGAIINVSSVASLGGYFACAAYGSAKAAVNNMTKVAAIEFAPDNIRVNAICPGAVQTPMLGQEDNKEQNEASIQACLLKRIADADEVSKLCVFLAADATYSTGNEFIIDGGLVCQGR